MSILNSLEINCTQLTHVFFLFVMIALGILNWRLYIFLHNNKFLTILQSNLYCASHCFIEGNSYFVIAIIQSLIACKWCAMCTWCHYLYSSQAWRRHIYYLIYEDFVAGGGCLREVVVSGGDGWLHLAEYWGKPNFTYPCLRCLLLAAKSNRWYPW